MGITKIQGAIHNDERGKLVFFNEFSMDVIKRFYEINPSNTSIIRAWQGHLIESKWFYCSEGSLVINLITLDEKGSLRPDLGAERFELESNTPLILKVPKGFASGFKALEEQSKLLVFSDATLETSKADDFRFPETHYNADWGN
jgi:dTDP-4-dehydrorhamnose 3,5-epimerase-like enzyme